MNSMCHPCGDSSLPWSSRLIAFPKLSSRQRSGSRPAIGRAFDQTCPTRRVRLRADAGAPGPEQVLDEVPARVTAAQRLVVAAQHEQAFAEPIIVGGAGFGAFRFLTVGGISLAGFRADICVAGNVPDPVVGRFFGACRLRTGGADMEGQAQRTGDVGGPGQSRVVAGQDVAYGVPG